MPFNSNGNTGFNEVDDSAPESEIQDRGDSWRRPFETSEEYQGLVKKFPIFHTVDWVSETYRENYRHHREQVRLHEGDLEESARLVRRRSQRGDGDNNLDGGVTGTTSDVMWSAQDELNTETTATTTAGITSAQKNKSTARSTGVEESSRTGSPLGNSQGSSAASPTQIPPSAPNLLHAEKKFTGIRSWIPSFLASRLWIVLQSWVALTLIGLLVGIIAGCLNIITEWLGDLKQGHCSGAFYLNRDFCCWGESEGQCTGWVPWSTAWPVQYIIYIITSAVLGIIAAILCKVYAPPAAGSGISEVKVIVSGFTTSKFLGFWTLVVKSIGLPLVIASGLSVGKEGPSVHYAACAASVISSLFVNFKHSPMYQSQFLTAGAAAGVAVAFAAPIGGVLFAVEEISSQFSTSTLCESFYCAMMATGALSLMNTFRTGKLVIFQVHYDTAWQWKEVPFFLVLGLFGGLYGVVTSRFNIKCIAFRNRYLSRFPVTEVGLLCFFTAAIGYFSDFIRVDMTEGMGILFSECGKSGITNTLQDQLCQVATNRPRLTRTVISLLFTTALRVILVMISYNSKVPCGVFVPSMAAGASFGKAVGLLAEAAFNDPDKCTGNGSSGCVISGTYALLGAAAGLCGITDLTLTVVIIIFELTGALNYVVPTMFVVVVTKLVSEQLGLGLGGVCDQMIRFNGIPFLEAKNNHKLRDVPVSKVMSSHVVALPYKGLPMHQLRELLHKTTYKVFPVVDSSQNRAVLGMVSRRWLNKLDLGHDETTKFARFISDQHVVELTGSEDIATMRTTNLQDEVDLSRAVLPDILTLNYTDSLDSAKEIFVKLGPKVISVTNGKGGLAGIITRKDITQYELYLYYSKNGNVFVSKNDEIVFNMIYNTWRKFTGIWSHTLGRVSIRRHHRGDPIEIGAMSN